MRSVYILLLALCLSCAGQKSLESPQRPPFTLKSQYDATVVVEATNGYGSGVIISDKYVLTAYHVVDEAPETIYQIHLTNGKTLMMVRDKFVQGHDVARLRFVNPSERFVGVKYPTWAPLPEIGQRITLISGGPTRNVRDGLVEEFDVLKIGADVGTSTIIEPGNSGSGLYDSLGRLVAITTRYYKCQNTQICGGRGASLIQYEQFFLLE